MFGTAIHKRGVLIVFGVTAVSTSAFAQTAAEIIERESFTSSRTYFRRSSGLSTATILNVLPVKASLFDNPRIGISRTHDPFPLLTLFLFVPHLIRSQDKAVPSAA